MSTVPEIGNNPKAWRETAQKVLEQAKAREEDLLAAGARYVRVDAKTVILKSNGITKSKNNGPVDAHPAGDVGFRDNDAAETSVPKDDLHGAAAEHPG